MRYIQKSDNEPLCLTEYKKECEENRVPKPWLYKDFNRTNELRKILISEQHYVCCYCQRRCKAYRTEHSFPENPPNISDKTKGENLQLDYTNLFASCIDSSGYAPENQYCDVAKGNKVIREFIKEKKCSQYFRYNSSGEIIPNGSENQWCKYQDATSLTRDEAEARNAIQILNLNAHTLIEARKECLSALLTMLNKKSKEEWLKEINEWFASEHFPDFIELRLQYINKYIQQQQ